MANNTGQQYERHLVRRFIHLMGVYPPATPVRLTDGSVGIVVDAGAGERPLVKVLFDADEPPTFPGSFRTPPISWNYTDARGARVRSGDYRVYFQAGDFISTSDVEVP